MVWYGRHTASIVQDAECGPAPAPGGGSRAQSWGVAGWGRTGAGPACSGGVGVPGGQAAAGVGALQVDALGGRGAVMLRLVGTLVPICRWERHRTGREAVRKRPEAARRMGGGRAEQGRTARRTRPGTGGERPAPAHACSPAPSPGAARSQLSARPRRPSPQAGWLRAKPREHWLLREESAPTGVTTSRPRLSFVPRPGSP